MDLFGALETDPDGLGVKASRCKLLAGQSVQVDFAARSGGKMKVNLFPGGVLGSDAANVSALQGGTILSLIWLVFHLKW